MNPNKTTKLEMVYRILCKIGPVTPTQLASCLGGRTVVSTRNILHRLQGYGMVDCIELADGSRRKLWWPIARHRNKKSWQEARYDHFVGMRPGPYFLTPHRDGILRFAAAIKNDFPCEVYLGDAAADYLRVDDGGIRADGVLLQDGAHFFLEYERILKSRVRYDAIGDVLSWRDGKSLYATDTIQEALRLKNLLPPQDVHIGWLNNGHWEEV